MTSGSSRRSYHLIFVALSARPHRVVAIPHSTGQAGRPPLAPVTQPSLPHARSVLRSSARCRLFLIESNFFSRRDATPFFVHSKHCRTNSRTKGPTSKALKNLLLAISIGGLLFARQRTAWKRQGLRKLSQWDEKKRYGIRSRGRWCLKEGTCCTLFCSPRSAGIQRHEAGQM